MSATRGIAFFLLLGLSSTEVSAQDAGVEDVPTINPMGVVMAARGAAVPIASHTRRHRGPQPYDFTQRLTLARGHCYEVLGYATGVAPVFAQVMAGASHVGDSLALTNSVGRVARQRFCASESGDLYSLVLRAEGEAWWYLAVVPVEGTVPTGLSALRANVNAPQDAGAGLRFNLEQHPVGGGDDYIARQIQLFARQRAGLTGMTATTRTTLATNAAYEFTLAIPSGRCVDVVAAGVPSVADLVVELEDPSGHRVARDATRRNVENIRYCTSYAGNYHGRVRVFSGAGLVGVQTLLEP